MGQVITRGMKIISTALSLCLLGYGYYWVSEKNPQLKSYIPVVKNRVMDLVNSGSFPTLEARHSPEHIMEINKKVLIKDAKHKFLETELKFYPYLLMEVKYTEDDHSTGEGVILWDMIDGEMVINTKKWEKTHGFGDCIKASAERYEYRIINIIAKEGGTIDRGGLSRALQIENEVLDSWIDSCRKKKLIVQSGNHYRLHLHNPRLNIVPQTIIDENLVTKSYKNAERLNRRFSPAQIKRASELTFGQDFAIRNVMDIYLPIYSITVQNPDGSIHTTLWNAVNGQKLKSSLSF